LTDIKFYSTPCSIR